MLAKSFYTNEVGNEEQILKYEESLKCDEDSDMEVSPNKLGITYYLHGYREEVSRQGTIFQQIITFENWTLYAIFGVLALITIIYAFTLFFINTSKTIYSKIINIIRQTM